MSYCIKDRKIRSATIEVNVVFHCNLSCRACSHLSPYSKPYFVDPDSLHNDLIILSKYFHAERINLLGGEPLLHPRLLDIIDVVKDTGIADKIRVVTNGLLLSSIDEYFWRAIDELSISVYPQTEAKLNIDSYKHYAQKYNKKIEILYFDYFREAYSEVGTDDIYLIRRIFKTCQIAHIWQCHTVHNGFFYKCPQSLFIPMILKNKEKHLFDADRVKIIDSDDFFVNLLNYLQSSEPLKTCRFCLGSVGKLFPHQMIPPKKVREQYKTEELLDWGHLKRLERDPKSPELCLRHQIKQAKEVIL